MLGLELATTMNRVVTKSKLCSLHDSFFFHQDANTEGVTKGAATKVLRTRYAREGRDPMSRPKLRRKSFQLLLISMALIGLFQSFAIGKISAGGDTGAGTTTSTIIFVTSARSTQFITTVSSTIYSTVTSLFTSGSSLVTTVTVFASVITYVSTVSTTVLSIATVTTEGTKEGDFWTKQNAIAAWVLVVLTAIIVVLTAKTYVSKKEGKMQPMQLQSSLVPESVKGDVPKSKNYEYDVFISHASEDKEEIARPLAEALTKRDLRVWYDESTLRVGDSLRRAIDHGLANSRYGVVILSPSFFKKNWPQKELDGLVAREDEMQKVILPIWHQVNHDDVAKFSLLLADRVAAKTEDGLDTVANKICEAMEPQTSLETNRRLLRFHLGLLKEELDGYAQGYKSFLGNEPNSDEVTSAKRLLALESKVQGMDLETLSQHILEVKEVTDSIIELSLELSRLMEEEAAMMSRPD